MESSTSTKPRSRTIRRVFTWLAVPLLGFAAFAFVTAKGSTPSLAQSDTHSIAEERMIELGGVEQYVLLRGKDRTAPLLVYVHGGPGASATPFLRTHNAELENEFIAVYWDQRGAAKSFNSNLDPAYMTIDKMTADLGELIDLLLAEFNQEQVILVGHSWGTVLALEHVANRPETVAAYIAVSQTTNQSESNTLGVEWALAQAQAAGDENAIAKLEAIGLPPYTIEEFYTQRRYLNQFGGTLVEPQTDLDLLRLSLATSEFAWPDAISFVRSTSFSGRALWAEQQQYDAQTRHSSIEVPMYLMLGQHDKVISPELGIEYFDSLEAPEKELIWFEESAHAPLFEEPEKFNRSVKEIAEDVGIFNQ
ncbi:MAG: alpha/beta fold hydrolase [Anaerolineae bacterium]